MAVTRGLKKGPTALAVLATGALGVAVGFWDSISPYIVRHDLGGHDHYFDKPCMFLGGLVGLFLGAFGAKLHRSKLGWIWSFASAGLVSGVLPFLFRGDEHELRRASRWPWCSAIAFSLVHRRVQRCRSQAADRADQNRLVVSHRSIRTIPIGRN